MTVKILHNPKCSKSRQTLRLLRDRGFDPEVTLYLETPPSAEEIADILKRLGMSAPDLIRRKEASYKELGLAEKADDEAAAMARRPIPIERPIVISDRGAALGRPPEAVLDIL